MPVTGTSLRTPLGSSATTVGAARHFVRDVLSGRRVAENVIGSVELLTSEVVTNALLHTGEPGELTVTVNNGGVRVEVSDRSPLLPTPRTPATDSVSGRGLTIVAALSRAWGVQPGPGGGKRVWFEVDC